MGDFLLVLVVSIQVLKITNKENTNLMYYSLPLHQWNKDVSNTRFYFTFEFCLFPKSLEVWGFFVTFITISQFYFFFKQETDIDNIHQLVVGATENIKEGNEDIREVIFWSCVLDSFLFQVFPGVALKQHVRARPRDWRSGCWVSGQGFGKTVQGSWASQ